MFQEARDALELENSQLQSVSEMIDLWNMIEKSDFQSFSYPIESDSDLG